MNRKSRITNNIIALIVTTLILWFSVEAYIEPSGNKTPQKNNSGKKSMKDNESSALERLNARLSKFDLNIIQHKGTERAFTGKYTDTETKGKYLCKRCGNPLFVSTNKFHSGCGWGSFDDEVDGAIRRNIDADGSRMEILCQKCDAHLGHEFLGEGFTEKNRRHCVNSASIEFIPDQGEVGKVVVAGGCFWGVEYYLDQLPGVISAISGYMGGTVNFPSYRQITSGTTGHLEVVEVIYDTTKTTAEKIMREFFETHNFEQTDGQGPDIGSQYLSAIFYYNQSQKETADKLISDLTKQGYKPATSIRPVESFWPAEDYHQDYYEKKGTLPYCHTKKEIFGVI